jgi:hypothetical protein
MMWFSLLLLTEKNYLNSECQQVLIHLHSRDSQTWSLQKLISNICLMRIWMPSEAEHVRLFEKHLACTELMQFHTESVTLLGFPCSTSTSSCVPLSLFPVPGQMYQICNQLACIQPFWFVNPQKQLQKSKLHSSVFQHAATSHEKFMSTASKDRCSPFTLAAYVSVIALFCWINAYHQYPAQISIMKDLTVIHNCKRATKPCVHFLWT